MAEPGIPCAVPMTEWWNNSTATVVVSVSMKSKGTEVARHYTMGPGGKALIPSKWDAQVEAIAPELVNT